MRHTVGLGDPITPGDITPADRVDDGLPQDLEASIRAYGLRYFKVKLTGAPERDLPRLRALARVLGRETGGEFFVTLDGNENFDSVSAFRDFQEQAAADGPSRALWPLARRRAPCIAIATRRQRATERLARPAPVI